MDAELKPALLCNLKSVCFITLPFLSPSSSPVGVCDDGEQGGQGRYKTRDCRQDGGAASVTLGIMEADGQEGRMTGSLPCSRAVGNGHDKGRIRPPRVADALA